MDDYLGRVEGLLIDAELYFRPDQLKDPWQLVNHGEPAEGLAMLAWVISSDGVKVRKDVIDRIRALTSSLVPEEDLPGDLDDWIDDSG